MEKSERFIKLKNFADNLANSYEDFEKLIDENRDLYESDPMFFIGLHVDFYLQREDISKALEVLSEYQKMKYISMEIEDFMKELKEEIIKVTNTSNKVISDEEIIKELMSNNDEKIIHAINEISKKNVRNFLSVIRTFLSKNKNERYQRLILIVLVEQHVDETFEFYLNGLNKKENPSKLVLPFEVKQYEDVIKHIKTLQNNPDSILRLEELYRSVLVLSFPDNPFKSMTNDEIVYYLSRLEHDLIGFEDEPSESSYENETYELLKSILIK